MAHELPHLHSGCAVERVVTTEAEKVLLLRFGHDYDPECMEIDEVLAAVLPRVQQYCQIHLVDTKEVPDFCQQYELYDPCTLMFFYRGRHVQIEMGMGDRFKITWAPHGKEELVDLIETVHRGAQQGRDLVVFTRDYALSYRF
eukprot:TRINITY_DN55994_c0_g1_i1.p2 TRINITY_DN55994_c0_g1~~TRINITY_DN55994_c0_g1_i1.p2  ORF type:complete len:143 (-),score=24.18 TRINITY_DN55994_c0_g1_i1:189-617(-)